MFVVERSRSVVEPSRFVAERSMSVAGRSMSVAEHDVEPEAVLDTIVLVVAVDMSVELELIVVLHKMSELLHSYHLLRHRLHHDFQHCL